MTPHTFLFYSHENKPSFAIQFFFDRVQSQRPLKKLYSVVADKVLVQTSNLILYKTKYDWLVFFNGKLEIAC